MGNVVGRGDIDTVLGQWRPNPLVVSGIGVFFLMTRSDELFATDAGVAHQVHCLTRGDVAFYSGGEQLPFLRWREARTVEIRFRGHKGDQLQAGDVLVRTRDAVRGLGSSLREGGGAVALLVELLSIHPNLPSSAPLASFRESGRVAVWSYGQALRALREVVAKSRQDPAEFALHSLRIGGASRLAAGGGLSERVIQREGRWKSDAYKVYTRSNIEDSGQVSRKLARQDRCPQREPGQGTEWGHK